VCFSNTGNYQFIFIRDIFNFFCLLTWVNCFLLLGRVLYLVIWCVLVFYLVYTLVLNRKCIIDGIVLGLSYILFVLQLCLVAYFMVRRAPIYGPEVATEYARRALGNTASQPHITAVLTGKAPLFTLKNFLLLLRLLLFLIGALRLGLYFFRGSVDIPLISDRRRDDSPFSPGDGGSCVSEERLSPFVAGILGLNTAPAPLLIIEVRNNALVFDLPRSLFVWLNVDPLENGIIYIALRRPSPVQWSFDLVTPQLLSFMLARDPLIVWYPTRDAAIHSLMYFSSYFMAIGVETVGGSLDLRVSQNTFASNWVYIHVPGLRVIKDYIWQRVYANMFAYPLIEANLMGADDFRDMVNLLTPGEIVVLSHTIPGVSPIHAIISNFDSLARLRLILGHYRGEAHLDPIVLERLLEAPYIPREFATMVQVRAEVRMLSRETMVLRRNIVQAMDLALLQRQQGLGLGAAEHFFRGGDPAIILSEWLPLEIPYAGLPRLEEDPCIAQATLDASMGLVITSANIPCFRH